MKFLHLKITSFNTSYDDLRYHQMENRYDGLFLQETNHNNSTTLEISKIGKGICTQFSKMKLYML